MDERDGAHERGYGLLKVLAETPTALKQTLMRSK